MEALFAASNHSLRCIYLWPLSFDICHWWIGAKRHSRRRRPGERGDVARLCNHVHFSRFLFLTNQPDDFLFPTLLSSTTKQTSSSRVSRQADDTKKGLYPNRRERSSCSFCFFIFCISSINKLEFYNFSTFSSRGIPVE